MHQEFTCNFHVSIEGEKPVNKEDLIKYLEDAVILDLDNEEYGPAPGAAGEDAGVSMAIDWESLKENKALRKE